MTPLEQLAADAGFTGSDIGVAAAIAMAESSGNPNKYNPEPQAKGGTPEGQGSYGLWQIYLKKHPEFAGVDLFDPRNNAAAAYDVFQKAGGSFDPWTTFRTGAFMQYLPGGPAPEAVIAEAPPADQTFRTGVAVTETPADDSFQKILLWAGLALTALWLFEEIAG